MRLAAVACLLGGALSVLPGCSGSKPTDAQLRLQREDLIAVAGALASVEGPVARELEAAKHAWPLIANGIPSGSLRHLRAPLAVAAQRAASIKLPALFEEANANALAGPAAALASMFNSYYGLSKHGWRLTGAAIAQIEAGARARASVDRARAAARAKLVRRARAGDRARGHARGSADIPKSTSRAVSEHDRRALVAARFARENVGLYIESVYDGHFDLAQIAKRLRKGYHNLGGPTAFGAALTPAEVSLLERTYSEPNARLLPHVGVRFGS